MTFNYPIQPGRRFDLGVDGTLLLARYPDGSMHVAPPQALQALMGPDVASGRVYFDDIALNSYPIWSPNYSPNSFWLLFPEARDIFAIFMDAANAHPGAGGQDYWTPVPSGFGATSPNTTNGIDGDWSGLVEWSGMYPTSVFDGNWVIPGGIGDTTNASANWSHNFGPNDIYVGGSNTAINVEADPAGFPGQHDWRAYPVPLVGNTQGIRALRLDLPQGYRWFMLQCLHLYGQISTGQNPQSLIPWHPTLEQPIQMSDLDAGDVAQPSTYTKQVRFRNPAASLTARSVVVRVGPQTPLNSPQSRAAASLTGYPAAVMADSPAAFWRMNEPYASSQAQDTTANNHPLSVYNALPSFASTVLVGNDTSANFAGSQALQTPGSGWMYVSGGAFSIEAWIKSTATGLVDIVSRRSPDLWSFRLNAGKLELLRIAGSVVSCASTATINDGNAHHVVGTYDGVNMKVYVDGSLATTVAQTGDFNNNASTPIQVGTYAGNEYFVGNIGEVAYYPGVALTATQVSNHFNGAASTNKLVTLPDAGAFNDFFSTAGAFSVSLDNATWQPSVSLGDIGPGTDSSIVYVKVAVGAQDVMGPKTAEVLAIANNWS